MDPDTRAQRRQVLIVEIIDKTDRKERKLYLFEAEQGPTEKFRILIAYEKQFYSLDVGSLHQLVKRAAANEGVWKKALLENLRRQVINHTAHNVERLAERIAEKLAVCRTEATATA
jgi:hypothetical protein